MKKYRIAVGAPTLKDASNEAIACSEHLKKKGVRALWYNRGHFYTVSTEIGIIEFIPYAQFKNLNIFAGKAYTTMFDVPEDATEIVRGHATGDTTTAQCFLDWVEIAESAKEEKIGKSMEEYEEEQRKALFGKGLKKMRNLADNIINLSVGDKVYLKPYERVKQDVSLSEDDWNSFCGKFLKVTDIKFGSINYADDFSEDFCTLYDEERDEYIMVPTWAIASVYKKGSSKVNHPDHYNQNGMEVWDVIKAFTSNLSGVEAFYAGNAIKYILRWDKKNGVEDLEKAKVYIDKIIEGRKEK